MVPYNEDSQLVIKGMEVLAPFFILGMEVLVPCKYGKCLWRDIDQLFSIGYLSNCLLSFEEIALNCKKSQNRYWVQNGLLCIWAFSSKSNGHML